MVQKVSKEAAKSNKKRKRGEKKNVGEPEEERVRGEPVRLWRIVTDYRDVFNNFILPKLSGNDVKFLYDVNTESREAIKRSGVRLKSSFKIRDFDTISLVSWAFSRARGQRQIFCETMARNGNLELLKSLRLQGCSWNVNTCHGAAENGHLECLKYARENGCPWDEWTPRNATGRWKKKGSLECLKYALENGCPGSTIYAHLFSS